MPDEQARKRLINAAKSAQAIAKGDADPKLTGCMFPPISMHSQPASASCHPRYVIGNRIDAIPMEQRAFY
jgi:hypothetical protein